MTERVVVFRAKAIFDDLNRKLRKTERDAESLKRETGEVADATRDLTHAQDRQGRTTRTVGSEMRRLLGVQRQTTRETERAARIEKSRAEVQEKLGRAQFNQAKAANAYAVALERMNRVNADAAATDMDRQDALLRATAAAYKLRDANDNLEVSTRRVTAAEAGAGGGSRKLTSDLFGLSGGFRSTAAASRDFFAILRAIKFPVIIALIHTLVGIVSALSAGLVQLAGELGPVLGLFGAVPGTIFAVIGAVGALMAAFKGLGDALKAQQALMQATTPQQAISATQKLKEAYEALSPAAQRFVELLGSLRTRLTGIRQAVQTATLPGFAAALRELLPLIPTVTTGLSGMGRAFGQAAQRFAQAFASPRWQRDLGILFNENIGLARTFGNILLNLAEALRDVAIAAIPLVRWIANLVEGWTQTARQSAAAGRATGTLADFFDRTRVVTRQLLDTIRNLWGILVGFSRAAQTSGINMWGTIRRVTGEWARWLKSFEGQNALVAWMERARPVVEQVFGLVGDLAKAFANISGNAESGMGQVFVQLRQRLIPAMLEFTNAISQAFTPALINLATELVRVFTMLSGATGGLTIFVNTLATFLRIVNDLIETVPGLGELISLFFVLQGVMKGIAVVGSITGVTSAIKALTVSTAVAQKGLAGIVLGFRAASGAMGIMALQGTTLSTVVGAQLFTAFNAVRTAILGLIPVTTAFAGVLAATGIGAVIAGVVALGAALWGASKDAENFEKAVEGYVEELRNGTTTAAEMRAEIAALQKQVREEESDEHMSDWDRFFHGWFGEGGDLQDAQRKADQQTEALKRMRQDQIDELQDMERSLVVSDREALEIRALIDAGEYDAAEQQLSEIREREERRRISSIRREARAEHSLIITVREVARAYRASHSQVTSIRQEHQQAVEDAAAADEAYAQAQEGLVDALEAVSDAERALADSHVAVRHAQEALTDAREEARESLAELRREAERQWLTEREAQLSLIEARKALARIEADASADWTEKVRARLAVRQAEWDLADTRRDGRKREEELREAERKGVEGSDQVRAARKALRDAIESQSDAARALTKAQEGVVDAQEAVVAASKAQMRATQQLARLTRGLVRSQREAVLDALRQNGLGKIADQLDDGTRRSKRILDELAGAHKDSFDKILEHYGFFQDKTVAAMSNFSKTWSGVRQVFAEPINWVTKNVLTPFFNHIGKLSGRFGQRMNLPAAPRIPTGASTGPTGGGMTGSPFYFARGGWVPGRGSRDTVPAMLTPGEFVLRKDVTARIGPDVLEKLNKGMRPIEILRGGDRSMPGLMGRRYAQGGLVQEDVDQGKRFARSQAGKPYVWGGVGPDGYDCSGFMSAVTNVLLGRAPHTRLFSTASFMPGRGVAGYQPGTGTMSLGVVHGSPGHMAGTLAGLNIESRGGDGVVIGSGARGALDDLFTMRFFLGDQFAISGRAGGGGQRMMRAFKRAQVAAQMARSSGPVGEIAANAAMSVIREARLERQTHGGARPGWAAGPVVSMVRRMARREGWVGPEWEALYQLVSHESGWNPLADNGGPDAGSSAYGLFQFLDSTWGTVGGKKTNDPYLQALYGFRYIKRRYGSPSAAWQFWLSQNPHWYARGGGVRGSDTVPAMLTPGEFVLRKDVVDRIGMRTLEAINSGAGLGRYSSGGFVTPTISSDTSRRTLDADESKYAGRDHGGVTELTIEADGRALHRTVTLQEGRNKVLLSDRD